MKKILFTMTLFALFSCKEETKNTSSSQEEIPTKKTNDFKITPISHATMMIEWDGIFMYVDPVGDPETYDKTIKPDIILVTDIHGDHLNPKTIEGLPSSESTIIAPQAVKDKMPEGFMPSPNVLANGESNEYKGFAIEGVPMYNLREEALKFHTKGRGNGYVIEKDGFRIYVSGDTEDIPEMRNLKDIDVAFVCMNLPYTMTVESAASAVLEFKPKKVYPYHYRGTDGMSDVAKFKELVNSGNSDIEVVQLDWYPN